MKQLYCNLIKYFRPVNPVISHVYKHVLLWNWPYLIIPVPHYLMNLQFPLIVFDLRVCFLNLKCKIKGKNKHNYDLYF